MRKTKKISITSTICLCVFLMACGKSEKSQLPVSMPSGVSDSSSEVFSAPVLKVYSAQEGKHKSIAYVVKWKGSEVIVSDSLGISAFRVGESIRVMAHKVSMEGRMVVHSLNFSLAASSRKWNDFKL